MSPRCLSLLRHAVAIDAMAAMEGSAMVGGGRDQELDYLAVLS